MDNILYKKRFIFILIFILSKIIIISFFELRLSSLSYGYHLLDKSLLKDDLLKSLLFLHSQPLLWNFFNGLVIKMFDGDSGKISIFFTLYHYLLTSFIIYFSIKILKEFNSSIKAEYFLFLFIILNPTVIFYEHIFSYAHTTSFLFTLTSYFAVKLFLTNQDKYEFSIYFTLLILSLTWVLFQPIIILSAYILILVMRKFKLKTLIFFLLIFSLSLIPFIKNKLIFDVFTSSSKGGQDFGTVFLDWQKYCGHPIKDKEYFTNKYYENYSKTFNHPSLIGERSHFNNLGIIVLGEECIKKTTLRIIEDPKLYITGRVKSFLASHGKFGFDYIYPTPLGWSEHYSKISNLYKNNQIKLIRQIIVFTLMMFIYFTLIKFLLTSKYKKFNRGLFFVGFLYMYLVTVGTMAAGTEQERILYTGFIINILFVIILQKSFFKKNN